MASRSRPAKLVLTGSIDAKGKPFSVRCASQRDYAIARVEWDLGLPVRRAVVRLRSDSPKTIVAAARKLPGTIYVFDLTTGEKIWTGVAFGSKNHIDVRILQERLDRWHEAKGRK